MDETSLDGCARGESECVGNFGHPQEIRVMAERMRFWSHRTTTAAATSLGQDFGVLGTPEKHRRDSLILQ